VTVSGFQRLQPDHRVVAAGNNGRPTTILDGGDDAMKCIFEVRYEFQWHSSAPTHWEQRAVKVCVGPDAQEAVEKAKKAALAEARMDDNGAEENCTGFRLREVILIAEAQL